MFVFASNHYNRSPFLDLVTEKVWESQSESDNDEPEGKTNVQKETNVVKAPPTSRPANKKASGSSKAGKQSSLMSFFKKK